MAEQTNIEWCDSTWNPWIGCTRISPACDFCYAADLMDTRLGKATWGAGQQRVRTGVKNWNLPLRWNREADAFAAIHGRRRRVFCASLADVFDNEVDRIWRADVLTLIARTPDIDWLLLTKRIGNVSRLVAEASAIVERTTGEPSPWEDGKWPSNVWIGATIANQAEADRDIPKLLRLPAAVRFLSMEPLLGPVDLAQASGRHWWTDEGGAQDREVPREIDWVIAGGESGASARPMHPQWVRSLRDQCSAEGVPFLFKQWGEWAPILSGTAFHPSVDGAYYAPRANGGELHDFGGGFGAVRVGKHQAGRLLDGAAHNGYPAPAQS